jgi:5-methyltetrahydrofolate--homocysteine methyltransferase
MSVIEELRQSVIEAETDAVSVYLKQALDDKISPDTILNEGLISGMREVGRLFEAGEFFVPEMLLAARTMEAALKILKPHLAEQGVEPVGKVAIGTVKGDLHDIGKSLVSTMLEGGGFAVTDLGVDVQPEQFIEAIQNGAEVVAISALLTTTMMNMKTTIEALKEAGVRDKALIMVGGAPVTEDFAKEIGADGYAPDASASVRRVRELMGL